MLASTLRSAEIYLRTLSPSVYGSPVENLSGASIGKYTRHMIEFLDCLCAQAPRGTINYDLRSRREQWQTDPRAALDAIKTLIAALETLSPPDRMHLAVTYTDQLTVLAPTTYARELAYNIEHIIHHLALIRVGLRELDSPVELPAHFGVAPSTLRSLSA